MKIEIRLIIFLVLYVSAEETLFDCEDAEDRLRCKVRRNCPEKRIVPDRRCPFKRVCCRGPSAGIFAPLRMLPFYQHDPVYNYLVNRNESNSNGFVIVNTNEFDDMPAPPRPPVTSSTNSYNVEENTIAYESPRKSVYYCKKYQELTIEHLYAIPLSSLLRPFTLPMDNCLPQFIPLVVGGRNAAKGEFPHMAAVGYDRGEYTDYLCGGTLISEKFVLTAAHCTDAKWGPVSKVMLGSVTLYSGDGLELEVKRAIPYPEYRPPAYYHDIALLELHQEVTFSQYLRPACLPQPGTKAHRPGSITFATGWGKTGFAYESSLHLLKVPLKVVDNKDCEEFYRTEITLPALKDGINDKLICAGGHENEFHDTCQGDSGGPLQSFLPRHKCMLEVIAVTSFGKTCGAGMPGVYTKVEPYITWIENIVWS